MSQGTPPAPAASIAASIAAPIAARIAAGIGIGLAAGIAAVTLAQLGRHLTHSGDLEFPPMARIAFALFLAPSDFGPRIAPLRVLGTTVLLVLPYALAGRLLPEDQQCSVAGLAFRLVLALAGVVIAWLALALAMLMPFMPLMGP